MNPGSDPRTFPWREWLAAFLWLALIAIESTPWLSSQNTGHVLYQLLVALLGPINVASVTLANSVLREVGHVTGYGVLSWLLFRAWRSTFPSPRALSWRFAWGGAAFLLTAAVASLDEFHQSFLSARTGSIRDVFLDSAAALAVQLLLFAILRKRAQMPEKTTVAVG